MNAFLLFGGLWLFTFVTLAGALVLLNLYSDWIGSDFALHGIGKELTVAAVCSLIEAASVWAVVTYVPSATRALFIPVLLVWVIYRVAHLDDWGHLDAGWVLLFQFALMGILGGLVTGHFGLSVLIGFGFAAVLGIVAAILRGL